MENFLPYFLDDGTVILKTFYKELSNAKKQKNPQQQSSVHLQVVRSQKFFCFIEIARKNSLQLWRQN